MISASHNPFEHNGIKVFSGQGYKLSDALEARIEEKILSAVPPANTGPAATSAAATTACASLKRDYIDFVASTLRERTWQGLRILVDCANVRRQRHGAGALRPLQGPDGLHPLQTPTG